MKTKMDFSRRRLLFSALALAATHHGAQAAKAQSQRRPNIFYTTADDWSHGHAGAYGSKWVTTPTFDRIAREGALFNNCFTSNPKCSPCRASILTGRNTWQLEEAVNHAGIFPSKFAVYPGLLEEAGHLIGYTGKGWGPGDYRAGGFKRNPAGPEYAKYNLKAPFLSMSSKDYARNFEYFLEHRRPGQPFCFWFGPTEPHRDYEYGSGVRSGKDPKEVDLPADYPDHPTIRRDMLDYAIAVEWFDKQLGRIIRKLEEIGELDNTFILVTSDHGMPFPRVKGQIYEHGFHLPLAVRWGRIKGGLVIDDFINARDFAPTFLELAGIKPHPQMTGHSFLEILRQGKSGLMDSSRTRMLAGKERHDLGRPNDWGYPVRALRTPEYLYVHNYEPDRWPAGNPETGYPNCDGSPTKSVLLENFDRYYALSFGKRPEEELYRIKRDSDCVHNLAADLMHAETKRKLRAEMEQMLREDGDPRVLGNATVFDTYKWTLMRGQAYDNWLKNQQL